MIDQFDSKTFLKTVPHDPGIYQMFGADGQTLYVGKARNLQKRLASYFRKTGLSTKTISLVKQIHSIEIVVTHTENEALLLESNFIKKLRPRYNILLRDDKSYPYIVLSEHKDFPRLDYYRGAKKESQRYFGPYPSSVAARATLNLLQKVFKIRQCQDTFFQNRSRPCLQYQIKRCTAPCVGLVDPAIYQENVQHAVLFLEGKNQAVIDDLIIKMEQASQAMEFERAARYRDQIASLRQIQQQQIIDTEKGDVDVFAVTIKHGMACVHVLTIREGSLLGSKSFIPAMLEVSESAEILTSFIPQYYLNTDAGRKIPKQIIVSHALDETDWLSEALTEITKYKINITANPRGDRQRWLQMALQNAEQYLTNRLIEHSTINQRLLALKDLLNLPDIPRRMECFDISHSHGEATVASCVVFDELGPRKIDYRRFNITNVAAGDDYAAIQQALQRRYLALKTAEEGKLPDVLIIDGGKGQLKQAEQVLEELQITGIVVLAIAKGTTRKPGLETVFLSGQEQPLDLSPDSLALHLLQQIRDEAHRFAITGHRGRRAKVRQQSVLQEIPGIGAKRRRELLRQFGGLQELKRSSVDELAKIPGISRALAERIYQALKSV
jgi:excinuclease ABC subunit C